MWKRMLMCISGLGLFIIFLNYITETIPLKLYSDVPLYGDFSVLCYNVKCKDKNFRDNQIKIANEILKESPDVVFLCEMHRSVGRNLDSVLTRQGGYKSCYRSGANCIFYSRYVTDSIKGLDTGTSRGRNALNNLVHVNTPQGPITIIGCHLSSSGSGIIDGYRGRKREVDSIYKVCINEIRPLIVMGDFNDVSGTYPINRLKEAGLKDAWWEAGKGYGTTFHEGWLKLRIDHILYDYEKIKLVGVKVMDNNLSDHNALMATFRIKMKQ